MIVSAISSTTDSTAFFTSSRVTASTGIFGSEGRQADVAVGVQAGRPVRRHDRGRVVLFHDQWTRARRAVQIAPPDYRRRDTAVVIAEIGASHETSWSTRRLDAR